MKYISQLLNFQIEENDGLPKKLCESCAVQIPKFFTFKSQCESADARLRHILQNTYSEVEIKYEVEMELECTSKYSFIQIFGIVFIIL